MLARVVLLAVLVLAPAARAELPLETTGRTETLPLPHAAHWVWVGDPVLRRSALVDVDTGRTLGMVGAGFGLPTVLFPHAGSELYVPETHYSRGSRGVRTDVLTIYDGASLSPLDEVVLPPKRAHSAVAMAHGAVSDDDRFAAVFNLTPATSLSIVDLPARRLAGEIATPGCSLVYAAGTRRFFSLCPNGTLLAVRLDERGALAGRRRYGPFFDPEADPVTEKAVRVDDRWLFVSFEGVIHPVDVSGEAITFGETWPLFDEAARREGWRIGGAQHLAVHAGTGRLFALVHRGGPDGHKDPGSEVWVYDLARGERVQRIELQSPGLTFLGQPLQAGPRWAWLVDPLVNALFRWVPELGIDAIAVTPDDDPRLVTIGFFSGGLASYDARSGAFLGRVFSGNMTNVVLQAPGSRGRSAR